ncbi:SH3 domain-containing protein [Vallitalea pronyensis]|uniref:SH3 domain-containing protein n=1 Tax=Vallitalea pronyensis TaxID=1348613 RepID=A0A8J8MH77_9FIRM|nr:CAP domain-containing protein [Vallitalea pronyensis]QUI21273.1 SH3 domain-containing protein [Vallitalea pronyensis]
MGRRRKNIKALLLAFIMIISLTFSIRSSAAPSYVFKWTNVKQVEITAHKLNVRLGPSTAYQKIGSVSKGHVLHVLGTLEGWYVVHMQDGSVGLISSTYTRVYAYYNPIETPSKPDPYAGPLTAEEALMVNLINTERKKAGLPAYEVNMELMRVARIKAEELSAKQYFSHESPVYGSPFKMLQDFSIHYTAASENIAGNQTIEAAHNALMNSPSHKTNIISTDYNYVGIGIMDDPRYGKVFVQMYIQNNKN